ncbi:GNAT family N-acetyltransferase [Cytobacillus praedii]|uniref:GNAT family N-acetyltransferase n=1 Tax=Cytobacillus praedii TaxID=1742358 RepID=UPI002E1C2DF2|nr:GNAT family N-acetyltransferase [Cytobacillus praedii]MED3550776.1 aminotransferase class V-fold PLP-dependent enzyme [Cytobacillus praedii]
MYWCKIARTEKEFAEIAKLNYETFVEEIPQHAPDPDGVRVDPFHNENQYIIVLKDQELVGMIAIRDQRPFSLDKKLGPVENLLSEDALTGKLCEIRLLAVRKEHRNGRVFFMLTGALSDYAYKKGYSAAVISGTVRELKLYDQMGFESFADPVGSDDAQFIPMVLTRARYEQSVAARLKQKTYSFFPGPVQLTNDIRAALLQEPISHRSYDFSVSLKSVQNRLLNMSKAKYVHVLSGSGTLANEAMVGQISRLSGKGLILTNGAFGERLKAQADRWNLKYELLSYEWGEPFKESQIHEKLENEKYEWLLMAHGETSTGMLNNLEMIQQLCRKYQVKLCVDCVSSFGAQPFSLADVYLATGVSGKAVGTMSGIAIVFSNHVIEVDKNLPSYLDLGLYANGNIPFTYSSQLFKSFEQALYAYENDGRYKLLQSRYELLLAAENEEEMSFLTTDGYPMIVTLKGNEDDQYMADDAALTGFELHYKSAYLAERGWVQLSIIQPDFEKAWTKFRKWHLIYKDYQKKQLHIHS